MARFQVLHIAPRVNIERMYPKDIGEWEKDNRRNTEKKGSMVSAHTACAAQHPNQAPVTEISEPSPAALFVGDTGEVLLELIKSLVMQGSKQFDAKVRPRTSK
jgi:hypothetical protein